MQPGDIIFSKPVNWRGRAIVVAQWLSRPRRRNWSHAAVCISGPLVIEALKGKGVTLSIWDREARSQRPYVAFRLKEPIDLAALREASQYFLNESYSLRARSDGKSYCSRLVQKIFRRMNISPFNRIERPLLPNALFKTLTKADNWRFVQVPLASVEELRGLDRQFVSKSIDTEISGSCRLIRDHMLQELDWADEAKQWALLIDGFQSANDAIDGLNMSDLMPKERKIQLLESYLKNFKEDTRPQLLAYRTFEYDRTSQEEERNLSLNTHVRKNWKNSKFNVAALESFAVGRSRKYFDNFLSSEVRLDDILRDIFKMTSEFIRYGSARCSDRDEFLFRAKAMMALFVSQLKGRGANSNAELANIILEIEKDYARLNGSDAQSDPNLLALLSSRLALLLGIKQFFEMLSVEISKTYWEVIYSAVTGTTSIKIAADGPFDEKPFA
jgi:hypothetical protein